MGYEATKCDPELGLDVQAHLERMGVHTPMAKTYIVYSDDEKRGIIEDHVRGIMETLLLDMEDDSLKDTPKRVAKMYLDELFWGLDPEKFPKCTAVDNKMGYDEMVVERNVNVMSSCEHHLVTIDGFATVGYIPKDKVIGLSKINRIVEYFSRRPQIQERLTVQIAETLKYILDTEDVAVVLDAEHYCVKSRGIQDVGSSTTTSFMGGVFRKPEVRAEFMALSRGN